MKKKYNRKIKLGAGIIIVSILLFLSLPVIPFLEMGSRAKITISTVVFISAEVTFYGGGFLLGSELFSKYKSYLNPKNWIRKRSEDGEL